MAKSTTVTVEELRAHHGELAVIRTGGAFMAFKKPSAAEWARFVDGIGKTGRVPAARALITSCRVHPSADALFDWLEGNPAAVMPLSDAIGELAGSEVEIVIEKN